MRRGGEGVCEKAREIERKRGREKGRKRGREREEEIEKPYLTAQR